MEVALHSMTLSMVNMVLRQTILDKHLDPKLSHMDLHIDKSSVCKLRKMSDRNQAERPFHTRGEDCILEDKGERNRRIQKKNSYFASPSLSLGIFENTIFSDIIYCDIKKEH